MRHVGFILVCLLAMALVGCKPSVPSEYIQPDELEDLLYDYYLASAVANQQKGDYTENTLALHASVLKEHGVTQDQFDRSMVYYMRHTDQLHKIYENLSERMEDDAKELGASVSEMGAVGSNAEGDTVNVWRGETSVALIPNPPYNIFSFSMVPDTTFHRGDKLQLMFRSDFIFQDGIRDGVVCFTATFKNDSVVSRVVHVSNSMPMQVEISDNDSLGYKLIKGYFMLNRNAHANGSVTTLKLMTVSHIKLIRRRVSKRMPRPAAAAPKPDSINPATPHRTPANPAGTPAPANGQGNAPLPATGGRPQLTMPSEQPVPVR